MQNDSTLVTPGLWVADHHDTPFYNDANGHSQGGDATDSWYISADGDMVADKLRRADAEAICKAMNVEPQPGDRNVTEIFLRRADGSFSNPMSMEQARDFFLGVCD